MISRLGDARDVRRAGMRGGFRRCRLDRRRRAAEASVGGGERICHQHRNRHRPDSARYGRDRPGDCPRLVEGHVSERGGSFPRLARGPRIRFMPTSMTVAPGLIQSPRTISARPIAATTMSASRTTDGRSRVFEWAIVTVQFSSRRSCAIGLPTRVGAAEDHRVQPRESAPDRLADEKHAAEPACTAPSALPIPVGEPAGIDRMKAVDVLFRPDRVDHRAPGRAPRATGTGRGCRGYRDRG